MEYFGRKREPYKDIPMYNIIQNAHKYTNYLFKAIMIGHVHVCHNVVHF